MQKRKYIFILVLIVLVFGMYWKTLNYELVWDSKIFLEDQISLIKNKPIFAAFNIGFFYHQYYSQSSYYRPLTLASFMIEDKIWGINNAFMRWVNILIFILSLVSLYIFLMHQIKNGYFPEIATTLFAVFPLNHDNIVWVVGRGDLFMLLWGILTLLFLQFYIEKNRYRFLILSSFFYLLGILSKEAFVFFLPFFFLYEFLKRKKLFLPYHLTNLIITFLFFTLKIKIIGISSIEFSFFPTFIENAKILISTLGFYFKTLVFPFSYTRFISLDNVPNLPFMFLGAICGILILYFLYRSRRDVDSIIPLSLVIFFLGGHILFAFASVFLFKIYSRFLMIPALGLVWFFSIYVIKLKERVRNPILVILCLSMIVSTGINSSHYQNSINFWQRAYKQYPNDGFILYQMANSYFDNEDYLSAELYLNKSLGLNMKREHALTISFLHAAIEYQRANYDKVFKWLTSVEQFEDASHQLLPYWKAQISYKKGLVHMAIGDVPEAENAFSSSIGYLEGKEDQKNSYLQLYSLYTGQNMWEQAEKTEDIVRKQFPSLLTVKTSQIKGEFDSLSSEEKIRFFIHYKNYGRALEILENKPELDMNQKLLVAKLLYQLDKKHEAEKSIDEIYSQNAQDIKVLNSLGNFFLKDLYRVKESLYYYEKSLEVNKNQPAIAYIVYYFQNEYLKKMKEVW